MTSECAVNPQRRQRGPHLGFGDYSGVRSRAEAFSQRRLEGRRWRLRGEPGLTTGVETRACRTAPKGNQASDRPVVLQAAGVAMFVV